MRPTLETPRLVLREWTREDAEAALALDGDAEMVRFLGRPPVPDVEAERRFLEERLERNRQQAPRGLGSWALVDRATGELVGNGLLKPLPPTTDEVEVGWHVVRRLWGQGYATEAGRALLDYGFGALALDRIVAVVDPANHRSRAVAERLGMRWTERTTRYYDGVELNVFEIRPPGGRGA